MKESSKSLEEAETKDKLADLISALADAKVELANVQEMLLHNDKEIRELNERLELRNKMKYRKPIYYMEVDEEEDGPYCQHCFDKHGQAIRLQILHRGSYRCAACNSTFVGPDYSPPRPKQANSGWGPFT